MWMESTPACATSEPAQVFWAAEQRRSAPGMLGHTTCLPGLCLCRKAEIDTERSRRQRFCCSEGRNSRAAVRRPAQPAGWQSGAQRSQAAWRVWPPAAARLTQQTRARRRAWCRLAAACPGRWRGLHPAGGPPTRAVRCCRLARKPSCKHRPQQASCPPARPCDTHQPADEDVLRQLMCQRLAGPGGHGGRVGNLQAGQVNAARCGPHEQAAQLCCTAVHDTADGLSICISN